MQHAFDVIEHLVCSDAHPFGHSCLELIICNFFIAKLNVQVLVCIMKCIFDFFPRKFVEAVKELQISCHRGQDSLHFEDYSELLVAHKREIAID